MATFNLLNEAVRGDVGPVVSADVVAQPPTNCLIKLISSVYGADSTLEWGCMLEESFDSGATFQPASGFPMSSRGGGAGGPRGSDGLASIQYAFDGRGRRFRASAWSKKNGAPASFSWGLSVTLI